MEVNFDTTVRREPDAIIVKASLLGIPREVRDAIYRNIFTVDEQSPPAWTVLRVNRQIRAEALAIFQQHLHLIKIYTNKREHDRLKRPYDVKVLGFDPIRNGDLDLALYIKLEATKRFPYHILELRIDSQHFGPPVGLNTPETCFIVDLEEMGKVLFNSACLYPSTEMAITWKQPFGRQHMLRGQNAIVEKFRAFARTASPPTVLGVDGQLEAEMQTMITKPLYSRLGLQFLKNIIRESTSLAEEHECRIVHARLAVTLHWLKIFMKEMKETAECGGSTDLEAREYVRSQRRFVLFEMVAVGMRILMEDCDPRAENRNKFAENALRSLASTFPDSSTVAPHSWAEYHFHCARIASVRSPADLAQALTHIELSYQHAQTSEVYSHERDTLLAVQGTLGCLNRSYGGENFEWVDGEGKRIGDSSWLLGWNSETGVWNVWRSFIPGLWGVGLSTGDC